MPYYQEYGVDHPREVSVVETTLSTGRKVNTYSGIDFDTWTRINTYRSGSPKGNVKNTALADITVDKYAYFLESTRDRKFESALRARGMDLTKMPPDKGHPFNLERIRHLWRGERPVLRPGYYRWDVKGGVSNLRPNSSTTDVNMPASSIETFAFQSWGRLAPTAEVFDAGQFLGELREGLPSVVPSLLKGKIAFFKDLGSDYLNIEFGWKPFINDLENAWRALQDAQNAISRPFGPIHRFREIETPFDSSSTTGVIANVVGGIPWRTGYLNNVELYGLAPGYRSQGTTNVSSETVVAVEQKNWFEANFFLLPKLGYDPNSYMSRLDSLVNVRLTPAVLWELAPWSWLVDWGLKIGDALDTAERLADDRVHAQYAYGMSHTKVRQHTTNVYNSMAHMYERKERVRANPYGFKVGGFAGLNTWQQSILLALGLTKTRR